MKKQQDEITAIMKMREAASSGTQVGPHGSARGARGEGDKSRAWGAVGERNFPPALQQAGDFICTVYLEEKRTETEQHVKVRGAGGGRSGDGDPRCVPKARL